MKSLEPVPIVSKFKNGVGISQKMNLNPKKLGIAVIALAILLGVVLTIVKVNFDSQAVFLCEAVQDNPDIEMSNCPAHTSSTPWLLLVAFGVAFLMLGSGIYLTISHNPKPTATPKPKQQIPEIDLNDFTEEEKKIYNLLKAKGGSMFQGDIVRMSGLSKVKVTRILDHLELDKEILERRRRGMSNLVVLK
jgi:hypothetical protein